MDTLLISVILPSYNGARYIRQAIESVLAQDYPNFELIVVNDASTDETPNIVAEFAAKDPRVRLIDNATNSKLVFSLNRGIAEAKGEFIARIDDDDIWTDRSKLSKQLLEFRAHPEIGVIGTLGHIIDENGKRTWGKIVHSTDMNEVRSGFWLRNQLIHTSILARKEALELAGWYRSEWLYVEDYDLWLRVLALGYEIMNLPDFSINYRVREGNTTSLKYRKMQWLAFRRLFAEKTVYPNFLRKLFCLSVRFALVIFPRWLVKFLQREP